MRQARDANKALLGRQPK
ncbi:hypothetical protein A2U01_0093693, partial [Trifolium medium]|nr:hypothetical protein [Trifolium medium]